jgi:putative N-acetylmannosamine-6-phosphate epimerase
MLETAFTRLVGCAAPIQVAPMGAISTPSLIAAASRAGALGMVGTAGMRAEQVTPMLDAVLGSARGPVGANMLMPFADKAVIEITAPRVRVFDFYHGAPDPSLVAIVHRAGALASWQVGSVEEAKAAVDAGCDLLAVRGVEGGGRMHGNQPLWPLLNAVLDAVTVPVLAAGGLATARDLAAVLAAGADGARMGTRFVATEESGRATWSARGWHSASGARSPSSRPPRRRWTAPARSRPSRCTPASPPARSTGSNPPPTSSTGWSPAPNDCFSIAGRPTPPDTARHNQLSHTRSRTRPCSTA